MASGLPVVASRIGGFQYTVVNNETGLHFSPGNASEMSDCIETLIKHPDKRYQFGAAGRQRAIEMFDWDTIVSRYTAPVLLGKEPENPLWISHAHDLTNR